MLVLLALLACSVTAPSECDALSPEACAEATGCVVIDGGQLAPPGVQDTATCWSEVGSASVGCHDAAHSCPPVERYAADPSDGACWVFAAGCSPAGWGPCDEEPAAICP